MTPGRNRGYRETPRRPPGHDRAASLDPAPGDLELVQAFLNTLRLKPKGDDLAGPRALADWLSRHGLLPAGFELDRDHVARARDARSGLRTLLAANSGANLDEGAVERLDQAAIGARAQARFDRDGSSRFELVSRDFDDALGTILGMAHAALGRDDWRAFKLCAHPECRRAFFDFTKAGNAKWCTRRCGNKARAKAWRRAQKAAGLKWNGHTYS